MDTATVNSVDQIGKNEQELLTNNDDDSEQRSNPLKNALLAKLSQSIKKRFEMNCELI